jgi:AraC family transcriptional regulator, regulatory protein of adaptative response / DNA-3-methyladenine glycosylase II
MEPMSTTELGPREVNAVSTTGIYCRAGCGGRPLAENCSTLASAVVAEAAGYRACLSCRPDRRSNELLDQATPAVVRQAVMLISEGALDDGNEAKLGSTIGISPRQLRRLFRDHVGASPDIVARSRRAHFARRLLDESDLPMGQVADASGFNSVRHMNRVIGEVFHFTPRELRSKRRVSDRLIADGGLHLRLPHYPGFDFDRALRYLADRAIPGVESVTDEAIYRRVTDSCGYPGVFEVAATGDKTQLEVVAHLPTFHNLVDDVARCRRMLGLDTDLSVGKALLAEDPLLGPLVSALPGITIPGAWDRFETSVRIILGQQVTVAAASTISGRVAERFGTPVAGLEPFELGRMFPSPDRLAQADLSGLGVPSSRATTLTAFAAAVADGSLDLYLGTDLSRLLETLQALPGIGPWTAHMVAMRVYGHLDAFPAGDLGLQKSAATLLGQTAISAQELEAVAERWRPWRSLAAVYLWQSPSGG